MGQRHHQAGPRRDSRALTQMDLSNRLKMAEQAIVLARKLIAAEGPVR
jgi:hypothetical protein